MFNQIVSRLAPTPSGYLHLGNIFNFLYTWVLVRNASGKLILRIDDMDYQRCRKEYVEDIFRVIDWLGIDYDEGPFSVDQFYKMYSIQTRKPYYREVLQYFHEKSEKLYVCTCSRKKISEKFTDGIYRGSCRLKEHTLEKEKSAMRIAVPEDKMIVFDQNKIGLADAMGDFVLWRRDDTPAYQFASVIDDRDLGVNLIVRGEDLITSSAAQRYLASVAGITSFQTIRFVHHPLLLGKEGLKLSKSDAALSIREMVNRGAAPVDIYRQCAEFFGKRTNDITSLDDLKTLLCCYGT